MDRLLILAKGDIRVIEKKLGIPENSWKEKLDSENLVRIDFIPSENSNLRIPDGNEIGADKLLWRPGGKTINGLDEAVVNPIKIDGDYTRTELDLH